MPKNGKFGKNNDSIYESIFPWNNMALCIIPKSMLGKVFLFIYFKKLPSDTWNGQRWALIVKLRVHNDLGMLRGI